MVEVEIMWEGKPAKVELKPLTFGELLEIQEKSIKRRTMNGIVVEEADNTKIAVLTLMKSIVKAPFEVNEENIKKLEGKWAMKLLEVANQLNSFQTNPE